MRKMLMVAVASGALIALTPATALAQHHSRRHGVHHARIHHRRVRHRRFGHNPITTPTTTPTTPPTTPTIATVTSFTNNVLTLTLADGSTVSGSITNFTRIVCIPSQTSGMMPPSGGQGDDDQGDDQGGDGGWGGHDRGFGFPGFNPACTTANLVAGTPVVFADLSIGQAGAEWDTVVLMPTTPTTTTPTTTPTTTTSGTWR
jgi:hypothetical protein